MKKFLFLLIATPLFFAGCQDDCIDTVCDKGIAQTDVNGLCFCDCTTNFTGEKCDKCIEGFTGENCDQEIVDLCENITCVNGECVDGTCDCPDGFEGDSCETETLCIGVNCLNDGTCEGGECDCPDGFTGDDCGVDIAASFIGEWDATDACQVYMFVDSLGNTLSTFKYVTTVIEANDGYQIANFGGISPNLGFATEISGTTITVPTSLLSADSSDTIEGTGELSEDGNTITWTYMTNFDGEMDTCTSDWVKRP